MPSDQSANMPPEGYSEDEMGLFVDPDASGPHSFDPPLPPLEPLPMEYEEEYEEEPPLRNPLPRRVLSIVGIVLAVTIVAAGISGLMLYLSVQRIEVAVDDLQVQASLLKDSFLGGDGDALRATAASIGNDIDTMNNELDSSLWSFAEGLPVVGTDVSNVKTVVACASDLNEHALSPLVDALAGVRFASLMQDGSIDTSIIRQMRDSVVSASPVIVANAETISNLPTGSIGRVNDAIEKVREPLSEVGSTMSDANGLFTSVLGMLGDEGQTRTYVLLAQTNSEIRAGGGFPGSIGSMRVTDGNIELRDFETIYDLKDASSASGVRASLSDEEYAAFTDALASDAAGITLTPNFVRSGEVMRDFWTGVYGEEVDGVFGLDPILVQRMLALTGGIVAEDGTEVNGDNAAYELLNHVYWRYGFDGEEGQDEEDSFFTDVANRAADQLLNHLGGVDFEEFLDVVLRSGADHRLQVWMANPDEESFVQRLGVSGKLEDDIAKPELGVYANDNTWSKISWYLDIWADIDEGVRNEDGTTTHRVTAHFYNNLSSDEAWAAPEYVYGTNPLKVNRGDMVDTVYIMAPLGATITDFEVHPTHTTDGLIPTGSARVYDRDTYWSQVLIASQGDTTCTFALTLPPEATESITVRTSPLCHE